MRRWNYDYDQGIPEEDRKVLESKKDAIVGALGPRSIFWQLVKDSLGRNHYRALDYAGSLKSCVNSSLKTS
jgi:hypothetical protein